MRTLLCKRALSTWGHYCDAERKPTEAKVVQLYRKMKGFSRMPVLPTPLKDRFVPPVVLGGKRLVEQTTFVADTMYVCTLGSPLASSTVVAVLPISLHAVRLSPASLTAGAPPFSPPSSCCFETHRDQDPQVWMSTVTS